MIAVPEFGQPPIANPPVEATCFNDCSFKENLSVAERSIGQLAAESGCAVQTIRHYEAIGLLAAPRRSSGGQRRYDAAHAKRLAFIRHARDLGLSLEDIATLAQISEHPDQPCTDADTIVRRHLEEVERRIARLNDLRADLERMLDHQGGGLVANCSVVDVLGDHSRCATTHHGAGEVLQPRRARRISNHPTKGF
jgi:DNA-binding transcriptional MerR regulator